MSAVLEILETPLAGVKLIQRNLIGDQRGYLERIFCAEVLRPLLLDNCIAQINRTLTSKAGTVRGMHFQYPPYAEIKIVSCLRGEVFDVAVDLRPDSPNFLRWHGEILSAENRRTLFIPKGFAHGFQTQRNDCEMLYLHTAAYQPAAEGGVNAHDPRLAISWPQAIAELSLRDASHPFVTDTFPGVIL